MHLNQDKALGAFFWRLSSLTALKLTIADLRETQKLRPVGGLAGVKRKGLASELLSARSDSYHLSWAATWDTCMPQELMAKVSTVLGLF